MQRSPTGIEPAQPPWDSNPYASNERKTNDGGSLTGAAANRRMRQLLGSGKLAALDEEARGHPNSENLVTRGYGSKGDPSPFRHIAPHIAQQTRDVMFSTIMERGAMGPDGVPPDIVTAAAFMMDSKGQPRVIIGVNGGESTDLEGSVHSAVGDAARSVEDALSRKLGIPVQVVLEPGILLAHTDDEFTRRLGDAPDAWRWHAEQKALAFISATYGDVARESVDTIGIAHNRGPCTEETAGDGCQFCDEFLAKEGKRSPITASWYSQANWKARAEWAKNPPKPAKPQPKDTDVAALEADAWHTKAPARPTAPSGGATDESADTDSRPGPGLHLGRALGTDETNVAGRQKKKPRHGSTKK